MTRRPPAPGRLPVARLSPDDLMQRAFEVGPLPLHVGAVLVLDRALDEAALAAVLAARLAAVPRLRQRILRTPPGLGRPVWVDDAGFDARRHVARRACPPPGDEAALLALAAEVHAAPLGAHRPLWRAVTVTGLAGGGGAVVLVLHHVLADGVGGLAVLEALVDGAPPPAPTPFPRRRPSPATLARDAWRERASALGRVPALVRSLRPAATELGTRPPRATGALLAPLSGRLALAVARVPLAPLKEAARRHGATVNDAVLAAVGGALGELLARRGTPVDRLVVSVPVTAPRGPGAEGGNRVGVMPVAIPTRGEPAERLRAVAAATAVRKTARRGASTVLSRPLFRALGALRLFGPFVRRQRLVDTFVTNVRGPAERYRVAGATVTDVVPLGIVSGNVTVACTVLSYAGALTTTLAADPDRCPDLGDLARLLQTGLEAQAT